MFAYVSAEAETDRARLLQALPVDLACSAHSALVGWVTSLRRRSNRPITCLFCFFVASCKLQYGSSDPLALSPQ